MDRIKHLHPIRYWLKKKSKRQLLADYRNNYELMRLTIKRDIAFGQATHEEAVKMGSDSTYWKGYCQALHQILDYAEGL